MHIKGIREYPKGLKMKYRLVGKIRIAYMRSFFLSDDSESMLYVCIYFRNFPK